MVDFSATYASIASAKAALVATRGVALCAFSHAGDASTLPEQETRRNVMDVLFNIWYNQMWLKYDMGQRGSKKWTAGSAVASRLQAGSM